MEFKAFHRPIRDWNVPAPLDRQLASLTIRNTRNDPDSCNVVLNANFGSTRLQLDIEGILLELDCSISQAEIRLYSGNAQLEYGSDFSKCKSQASNTISRSTQTKFGSAEKGKATVGHDLIGPSGSVELSGEFSAQTEKSLGITNIETRYPFNHLDFTTVSIAGLLGQTYLNGPEIVEYEGWRGSYKNRDQKVGIAASILVKEQWLEFSNPSFEGKGRIYLILKSIFASKKAKKANQFKILLAYLIRKSLQDPNETKFATLACSAFVLAPSTEQTTVFQCPEELGKVTIHPTLIEQFSQLPAGTHEDFVKSVIAAEASPEAVFTAHPAHKENKLVAPMASAYDVIDALNLLNAAAPKGPNLVLQVMDATPRNVRRDLTALGFLSASSGRTVDTFSGFQGTAESALLFSVSPAEWFAFTAKLLETNGLRFAAYKVGFEVGQEFGLEWGDSSQRRYGHNIKRWVAILHPQFADLKRDHVDYWYVRALKAQANTRGAIPIVDEELIIEFEYRKLLGQSYKSTALEVGISAGTYTNWKSKNPILAASASRTANRRFNDEQNSFLRNP